MEEFNNAQQHFSKKEIVLLCDASMKDAVTVFDLFRVIREKIKFVFVIIAAITAIAVITAMALPKVYRSKVIIYPPSPSDVQAINVPKLYNISAEDLIGEMYNNLQSNEFRRQFFVENKLYEIIQKRSRKYKSLEAAYNGEFENAIKIKPVMARRNGIQSIVVLMEGGYPEKDAEWLNAYVDKVNEYTVAIVKDTIKTTIDMQILDVEKRIQSTREMARKQRADEIVRLDEALLIAEKIDLIDPYPSSSIVLSQPVIDNPGDYRALGLSSGREYMQGAKALKALRDVLKKRTNDDSFVPELRELEEKLTFLKGYDLANTKFNSIRIGERARAKRSPYKPKVGLIIIVGITLGVFVSLLFVFLLSAYEQSVKKR